MGLEPAVSSCRGKSVFKERGSKIGIASFCGVNAPLLPISSYEFT